jgi:nucleotide-binding universal stress UspA family protein
MKVLWAFDPFQKNQKLNISGKKILETLFNSKKDSIEVAYVASKGEAELTTAFNIPESIRYSLYPKKVINAQLKKLKMRETPIDIISSTKISLSSMIQEFVKYTKDQKIDLVIMASNGKELLPRLIFGSFCETLIHSSECDLLIYHQKTKFTASKNAKKILYAHDFTPKGDLGLKRVIEYAKNWNAKITIVHIPMFLSDMTYEEFKAITEKRALEIENNIKKDNCPYEMIINYEVKPVHKIILGVANKMNADLITVSAQSSKFTALLGGSTTRQILRESKIPSLILKVK